MDSKDLARDINNFDRRAWNDAAETLCFEGIKQTFVQNPNLIDAPMQTKNKMLVESTYTDVWGMGIPLSSQV